MSMGTIGTGIAVGGGTAIASKALDYFFGDDEQTTTNVPWEGHQPALKEIASEASRLYGERGPQYFRGDMVADLTEDQLAGIQGLRDASATGTEYAGQLGAFGKDMMGQGQVAADFATAAGNVDYNQISRPDSFERVSGPQSYNKVSAASGFDRLAAPTQGMQVDPGSSALSMDRVAEIYNNPMIQGQIEAANRDTQRNLLEQQLPGLRSQAAATGNVGSSRNAVAQAVAERGALDRMADTSAQIMGRAYEQGLGVAGQEASQDASMGMQGQRYNQQGQQFLQGLGMDAQRGNLNAQLTQQGNDLNAQLANQGAQQDMQRMGMQGQIANQGAGQTMDQMRMNAEITNANNAFRSSQAKLGAGNLAASLAGQGTSALQNAPQMLTDASMNLMAGGDVMQNQNQNQINADVNKWNYEQNAPMQNLRDYNDIITGGGSMGGTQTSTVPGLTTGQAVGMGLHAGSAYLQNRQPPVQQPTASQTINAWQPQF